MLINELIWSRSDFADVQKLRKVSAVDSIVLSLRWEGFKIRWQPHSQLVCMNQFHSSVRDSIPLVFLGTEIEFHEKGVKNGVLDEEFPGVKDLLNSSQVENTS